MDGTVSYSLPGAIHVRQHLQVAIFLPGDIRFRKLIWKIGLLLTKAAYARLAERRDSSASL